MKAFVLHQTNDLRFETVNDPQPESGEALVAVKAAGICGSDIYQGFTVPALIPIR